MKNKNDIQTEINLLIEQYKWGKYKDYSKRALNAVRKKILLLTKCVQYLETNSRIEFINEQLALSNKRLEIISRDFNTWFNNNPKGKSVGAARAIKMFEKEMDKPSVLLQIKVLNYILSK